MGKQTINGVEYEVPDGHVLITTEKNRANSSAANDLKFFKSKIPDGVDIEKLVDIVGEKVILEKEVSKLKGELSTVGKNKNEALETLKGELDSAVKKITKLEDNEKSASKNLRDMKIKNKMNEIIASRAKEGYFLHDKFIDKEAIVKLDPDKDSFEQDMHGVLEKNYDEQVEFTKAVGGHIPPGVSSGKPKGVEAGGDGGDKKPPLDADTLSKQLEDTASRMFGG